MSELYLMITIANRGREQKLRRMYEEYGCGVNFITLGRGTAGSAVLDSFGLEDSEKAVINSFVTRETFTQIRKELQKRFMIDVPGTGVVFLVPISSVGGKRQLAFLTEGQDFAISEETTLKKTSYELIVVIANQGYTEMIMDAARSVNAGGGTVIHAKGTGMQGAQKFFGFVIAEEKEMIYIVSRSRDKDRIMRAIMDAAGMKKEAQAICFSLPVTDTAGMRLMETGEDE